MKTERASTGIGTSIPFTDRILAIDMPPEKAPEEWNDEDNCKIFIEQIEKLLSYAKLK